MGSDRSDRQVRRRRVFYIPGYDPFPPRRYRELYRREAAAQAAVSGYEIAVRGDPGAEEFGWHAASTQDGAETEARIEVLVWSDIVRDSMASSVPATYLQLLKTAWIYVGTGAIWRLMRLRKGPVIAALYPVGVLLAQLLLAVGLGAGVAASLRMVLPGAVPVLPVLPVLAGVVAGWALLVWFKNRDGRIFAHYLMHDYAYSAQARGATPPELAARLVRFRDRIAEALGGDADEVLLVGHSSGAHLGVEVLAGLIRAGRVPRDGPALGFLSLGQVVPMVSFLPLAHGLRDDLHLLSESDLLTWVDVSAPGDGCAFALCDPVAVSGAAGPGRRWPLVISAAFTRTLSPERWAALRWRFFRLHFQYLCAFDRPGDYDYFRITAGPATLAERFRGRAPSKSRIERVISGHVARGAAR